MAKEKQVPFQKIPEASKSTGLSMYFLRRGCWDGSIPHVKSGGTITSTSPPCCAPWGPRRPRSRPPRAAR